MIVKPVAYRHKLNGFNVCGPNRYPQDKPLKNGVKKMRQVNIDIKFIFYATLKFRAVSKA